MQVCGDAAERARRMAEFVAEALQPEQPEQHTVAVVANIPLLPPAATAAPLAPAAATPTAAQAARALTELQATQRHMWRVRWDNHYKETWWRLAVNGVAMFGAARYTHGTPLPCLCCAGRVSRLHHFWECPIATRVVSELQLCLPIDAAPLTRAHVWLLREPPGVRPCVWQVVALAALSAMNSGRRSLTRLTMANAGERQHAKAVERQHRAWQQQVHDSAPGTPAAAPLPALPAPSPIRHIHLVEASLNAVEEFWAALESFTSLYEQCQPPLAWADLPTDHPFVRTTHDIAAAPGAAAGGEVRLLLAPRPPRAPPW
jgi:hypothetical protein